MTKKMMQERLDSTRSTRAQACMHFGRGSGGSALAVQAARHGQGAWCKRCLKRRPSMPNRATFLPESRLSNNLIILIFFNIPVFIINDIKEILYIGVRYIKSFKSEYIIRDYIIYLLNKIVNFLIKRKIYNVLISIIVLY